MKLYQSEWIHMMDDFEHLKSVIGDLKSQNKEPSVTNQDPIHEKQKGIDEKKDLTASFTEDASPTMADDTMRPRPEVDLVPRSEWSNLREPEESWKFKIPVEHVLFTYTGTKSCRSRNDCTKVLKQLQRHHIALGYNDIIYNFMLGGDGRVYEGRGWLRKSGQIPKYPEENGPCLKIAHIGYYGDNSKKKVPQDMIVLQYNIVENGMRDNLVEYNASMIKDYNDGCTDSFDTYERAKELHKQGLSIDF